MAIYRGPGGPGDATADADSEAALISTLVTQAETAATNAGTSASSASSSATSASNSATSAATSASNASSSASTASTAATNASNSATSASTSASNAATSETNAGNSASAAATSATNASNSALAASTSESNAATSETNAANSATAATNSYDAFDDRYLGAKASAPSVDNDGNALLTGALYWNTGGNQLYVWDGSAWDSAAFNVSGGALISSDIGVTVQAYNASLQSISSLTTAADKMIYTTAADTYAVTTLTSAGRALLDDIDADTQRSTLGLGSISTLNTISLISNVTGTLPVANGGTGVTSSTGTGSVALSNYPEFIGIKEKTTVSATAATGTINYDALTQSVLYYTSNASGNWTLNIRGDSGTSLDSSMSTGQAITVVFAVTNGSTSYRQTGFQIDGNAVTPKWQGGSAPSAGNASSIDVYSVTVVKTGSATFTVFEAQTRFA